MLGKLLIVLAGSSEAYTLATAPHVGAMRAPSAQMQIGPSPAFGDNTFERRTTLSTPGSAASAPTGDATKGWYYPPQPDGDTWGTFAPQFGDNMVGRVTKLNTPIDSTTGTETSSAARGWYYPEQEWAEDQFAPQFGDNTYARRRSLSGQ